MAVTWDQESRLGKIFINGTENARNRAFTGLTNYEVMENSHSFYQIGKMKDSGKTFHGLVRELKVFKKALSDNEILLEATGVNRSGKFFLSIAFALVFRAIYTHSCLNSLLEITNQSHIVLYSSW